MSIEQTLERIAEALEKLAGINRVEIRETIIAPVVEQPRKPRRMKDAAIPAQQAAAVEGAMPGTMSVEADAVPGVEDITPVVARVMDAVALDAMADAPAVATGAELRAAAQQYIAAADKVGPDMVGKLVTFIQSVAKIFNPTEPKLIKIPDAKVPEAAAMIASWCAKEGIKV